MRMILLAAVIALAVDAINFSGMYSQTAWSALRSGVAELTAELRDNRVVESDAISLDDTVRIGN